MLALATLCEAKMSECRQISWFASVNVRVDSANHLKNYLAIVSVQSSKCQFSMTNEAVRTAGMIKNWRRGECET